MKIIQIAVGPKEVPLTGYLQDWVDDGGIKNIRPSMVICAGGAYRYLSWREKDPVALHFLSLGYNVFLLDYSVGKDAGGLEPLKEASDAIVKIRTHATSWLCDPNRICVLGFSAGGHVAASVSLLYGNPALGDREDQMNRPDACVLCYPVVTTGSFCHEESVEWVSGGDPKLKELLSLENQVSDGVPPFFIWHTVGDQAVPVENSLLLACALRKHGIPFELHLFQEGNHGLSMCNEEVGTPQEADKAWVGLCDTWLQRQFDYAR